MLRGQSTNGVFVVARVVDINQSEFAWLDTELLNALFSQIGVSAGDEILCRAVEELALRLSNCDRCWRERDWQGLRKCARSMIAIAEQVGMTTLVRVAGDVTIALDSADQVAVDATLFRLIRVGEQSLTAVWDLRNISV
jgi:hypothetical protein